MKKVLVLAAFLILGAIPLQAQSSPPPATAHGIELTWTASTPGTNPIAGYNAWRCTGSSAVCTATSTNWTQINSTPITSTNYLDPAAGLSTSTTYSYFVEAQDTQGELSGPSNISTCAVGVSFPTSPSVPGTLATAAK